MTWEQILGFLIFMGIAGFGWLNKAYEERKAAERRRTQKPLRREDLPEASRRQLYGEGRVGDPLNPPVARPRTAAPAAAPDRRTLPPTMPRQAPPATMPVRPVAMAPGQDEESRPAGSGHQRPNREEDQKEAARRAARSAGRQQAPLPPHIAADVERQRAEAQRQQQQVAAQRKQRPQTQAQRQQRPAAAPQAPPQRPQTSSRPQPSLTERQKELRAMFQHGNAIRRGIIFSEVLGPPRAFRDY